MRRDLNWKIKHSDGTVYHVRIHFFAKKFQFQFRDAGSEHWNSTRPPAKEDWEYLISTLERYYQRRRVAWEVLDQAKREFSQYLRENPSTA